MKHKLIHKVATALSLVTSIYAQDSLVHFNLPNLYNNTHQISNDALKGKVVLINIWASWCSGCKEEMPLFVDLQKEFKTSKFEILLSNIDSNANNASNFLKHVDNNKVLTCVYDENKILAKAFHAIGMPSSYLIDQNGQIIETYIGSLDREQIATLKQKIHQLLGT